MRKRLFLPWTAVLLMATACSDITLDENITVTGEAEREAGQIAFSPMEIGPHDSETVTRATQVTTAAITSYGVTSSVCDAATGSYTTSQCGSYFYNEEVLAETGRCGYYWPGSSYKISFFVYAPYGESALTLYSPRTRKGFPVYSYTVPQEVAGQLDFMTADVLDRVATPTTTPVVLTFQHRLADLRFKVQNQHPENALTVKSIAVCGMKYTGTLENDTWKLTGSANTPASNPFLFTANTNVAAGTTVDVTGTSNHFMVLPQPISSGTTFLVVKTTEYGSERTYTYDLDAALTLDMGTSYTFTLIVGDGLLVVDPDTEVNDWEVEQVYLNGSVDTNPQEPSDQNIGGGTVTINDWK